MLSRNEILELAKQFGLAIGVALDGSKSVGKHEDKSFAVGHLPLEDFVAFIQLVTAKERSQLAQEVEDIRSDECDFKKYEDTHNDGWLDACNAVLDTIYGWGRDFESKE